MRVLPIRLLTVLALVVTGAAAVFWLSEARRNAEHGRELEARVADLADQLVVARSERDAARADVAARDQRVSFLQTELLVAIQRSEEVSEAVERQREELERVRAEQQEHRIAAGRPMPEGLRLALHTLDDCLRDDGYDGIRFVQARALDDRVLREVEIVETMPGGRSVTYYRAGEMTVELDRSAGVVVLRLRAGHVLRDGSLEDLPDDGLELRFPNAFGPAWERRLPYLVRAVGEYPEDAAAGDRIEVLDILTRDRWRSRVGALCAIASTALRYEIGHLRTVRDGRLVDVSLHAYDGRRLLAQSAEVARLAVEVDRAAGVVSLLLEDGVLRKKGGETTIPGSGYRILLPGVTPEQAVDTMLGFVVERK